MKWAALGVALVGCYSPHVNSGAPCMPDLDNCPSGQSCETTAAGSFCTGDVPADGAPSGDGTRTGDGGPNCFGTGLVTNVCLAQPPSGALTIATHTIDTAMVGTGNCDSIVAQAGGPSLCVVAADSIAIPAGVILRAQGANPLLIIAATQLDIAGEIHVESLRGGTAGAGAQTTCPSGNGANGMTGAGGGGGGGSFGTAGAGGGKGENSTGGTAGATATPTAVRGGCAGGQGGTGDGGGGDGAGGAGGGAVYLIAGAISIEGLVDASGAGGDPGTSGVNSSGGAGGGGAGGLIAFDAPSVAVQPTGSIFANGGGGGGGGGNNVGKVGSPGSDPATYQAGGTGGTGGAGGGGMGGAGSGLTAGAQPGTNFSSMYCGGGGGGGGAGVIRVFQAAPSSLGASVSPPAQ